MGECKGRGIAKFLNEERDRFSKYTNSVGYEWHDPLVDVASKFVWFTYDAELDKVCVELRYSFEVTIPLEWPIVRMILEQIIHSRKQARSLAEEEAQAVLEKVESFGIGGKLCETQTEE